MKSLTILITALCATLTIPAQTAPNQSLRQSIQHTLDTAHINGGIAIMGIDFQDSLTINGYAHYPMESVFKFPLAIAVLDRVDHGKAKLTQIIHMPQSTLDTATWSPMIKDHPNQDIDASIKDLLRYSVSKSDNAACDALFRFMGGPTAVNNDLHNLGITGMAIAATEEQMKQDWQAQYTNWCQPYAMAQLLSRFHKGKFLSIKSKEMLFTLMMLSENPTDRILGSLPPGTVIAHKTGTSGTNKDGLTGGTNDVGIITLPDGRHYALVVYLSNYQGSTAKGAQTIATISKLVWDHYTAKN